MRAKLPPALALRQAKSKPILEDIHTYLEREQPQALPKSPEGRAIAYTLSNWNALTRYREDGDLEIDNNGAERNLPESRLVGEIGHSSAATTADGQQPC